MSSDKPILSVRNLTKTYDNGVQALKGISFDVYPGEFLVIIGLSGSGKSTLLRCLNRLHDPTSGEIIFDGTHVEKVEGQKVLNLRKNIGMIFQHFNLIPRHSVLSNVMMGRLGSLGTLKSLLSLFSAEDKEKAMSYCQKSLMMESNPHTRFLEIVLNQDANWVIRWLKKLAI